MKKSILRMLIAAILVLAMLFVFASCGDKKADKNSGGNETPGDEETPGGDETPGDEGTPDNNNGDNDVDIGDIIGW